MYALSTFEQLHNLQLSTSKLLKECGVSSLGVMNVEGGYCPCNRLRKNIVCGSNGCTICLQ